MAGHHKSAQPACSPYAQGFTLVEVVVGVGIFGILLAGVIGVYSAITTIVKVNREKIELATLANSYLEIMRNLPYSDIGTISGNPSGSLPDESNPVSVSLESASYQVFYEVTYRDDPADGTILAGTDPAPNDYKQVKLTVRNTATGALSEFITTAAPKGLEGTSDSGAIRINVYNAQGQPVPDASVHIENNLLSPTMVLDRATDASGQWIEVGLPASVNGYHIVVTKSGYSTDQTYPITVSNPNPIKPDATVTAGQVTQISFFIDLTSQLTIRTLSPLCQNLSGVNVNVAGAKLIGTNPDVLKFNSNFTSSAGQIVLNNLEWDTYRPTLLPGQGYMVYGTSPIQSIDVLPGASQIFSLILGSETTNSLLVIVKDAATGTALEGASVHLRKGGSVPQDYYGTTGGSVWTQSDWTGGPGQADFVQTDQYFSDDGLIDINSVPTGIRLLKITGRYVPSGTLFSSTFDTGTSDTDYTTLAWEPTSQHDGTSVKIQIASNNDATTWNYLGPDGTGNTFYTVPGTTINPAHNGDRYVRYKIRLETADDKKTPIVTSLAINYVSGCATPGQAMFSDLTSGNNYDLDVSLAGYQTVMIPSMTVDGYDVIEVLLSP